MQLQRKEELQRLANVMKLKEVNMTKLKPTDDIKRTADTFEMGSKFVTLFDW